MNRDEIIKLIEGNGLTLHGDIEHFAALVASAEREACAQMLEAASKTGKIISCTTAAKAIRARGQA